MSSLTKYVIRGYTSANPDFEFSYTSDSMRCAGAIKRALLVNVNGGTEWYTAIEETEDYSFSEDSERRDLRDTEAERVYVFNTITYSDDSDDPDGGDCFMVTINEEL